MTPSSTSSLPFVTRALPSGLAALLLASCGILPWGAGPGGSPGPADPEPVAVGAPGGQPAEHGADGAASSPSEVPVEPAPSPLSWVDRTYDELTLREKVGQLIMPWVLGDFAPEGSASHERILAHIEDHGVGGVIMSVGSPTEVAAKLNDLQRHARIPLLVAADLETGAGFRMRGAVHVPGTIDLGGATDFPSLMAVGATGDRRLAYEMGRITAVEARAVGIHVPFAPVLDVNNNPDNPIINVRSFGEDPDRVAELGTWFVRGIQENGAIATGKHFPGHGDTETDSHLALPVIRHGRTRMDSVELRPFRAAVQAGMGAVMTAHISVPSLNGGVREPSTLSASVLTNVLRDELGFGGLIFTDAMDMSAITRRHSPEEAAVRAIEAGNDVILMPPSVERAVDGIVEAVRSGRLPMARIEESVRRVLGMKASLGLDEDRFVDLGRIPDVVGIPAHTEVADRIAQRSITLLKNDRGLLPLNGTRSARVMSVTFRRESDLLAGRYFNRVLRSTYPRLSSAELTPDSNDRVYDELLNRARRQQLVIVGTYVTAVSYSGSVAVPDELVDFIDRLRRIGVPHAVVSFGNPYLISGFPDTQAYVLAWNGSEASQRAAARALLGEFEVTGQIPTRIPPLFEIGDGLPLAQKAQDAGAR